MVWVPFASQPQNVLATIAVGYLVNSGLVTSAFLQGSILLSIEHNTASPVSSLSL